ncbi:MAG: glycosyltransferase [Ruegeria sp.]
MKYRTVILSGDDQRERDPAEFLSVIVAAHNEESYIADCLNALLEQSQATGPVEVVVAANACTDGTQEIVTTFGPSFKNRDWRLVLLDIAESGKPNAFNCGDAAASGNTRIYLDADVKCDPDLLGQLRGALSVERPVYATGTLQVVPPRTWVTRRYAEFWVRLPFIQGGAVGAGLFAVNPAGRARWGEFPAIISDDTFVRLNFSPDERVEVPANYHWPMVEGARNLIRVRRRQDSGVEEIHRLYPDLTANEAKKKLTVPDLLRLMCQAPLGFVVYSVMQAAVRLRPGTSEWVRGR